MHERECVSVPAKEVHKRRPKSTVCPAAKKATIIIPDIGKEVKKYILIRFELSQLDGCTGGRHSWPPKSLFHFIPKLFHLLFFHPLQERLLSPVLYVACVLLHHRLIVDGGVDILESLTELWHKELWLVYVKPHDEALMVGLVLLEGSLRLRCLADGITVEVLAEVE